MMMTRNTLDDILIAHHVLTAYIDFLTKRIDTQTSTVKIAYNNILSSFTSTESQVYIMEQLAIHLSNAQEFEHCLQQIGLEIDEISKQYNSSISYYHEDGYAENLSEHANFFTSTMQKLSK